MSTPIDMNVKVDSYADSNKCDVKEYQELMGRLIFLKTTVNTTPDIAYTLSYLSQYNNGAREIHMRALKRVLRYLGGAINYRLCFGEKNIKNRIDCETDAFHSRNRSVAGHLGWTLGR